MGVQVVLLPALYIPALVLWMLVVRWITGTVALMQGIFLVTAVIPVMLCHMLLYCSAHAGQSGSWSVPRHTCM